ncbi:MAG: hypothetical protein HUJ66_01360, partial [Oscillospiraceae bacterium]|nr:hypothetical protein [Oscillospiraceae bacterium]
TDSSLMGNVVAMYYDGLAQLKMYEDGLAQLEDGKKQLAAGAQQLADGDAQLTMFEDGEAQLADGMMQLLTGMGPSYHQKSFVQTVDSLAEYVAKTDEMKMDIPELYDENGFNEAVYAEFCAAIVENLYQTSEDGVVCTKRDGKVTPLLDLDKCSLLLDKADQYMADSEVDTTAEVVARIVCYILVALACILGLIAGIMGFVSGITGGKKTGKVLGILTALLSAGAFVYALISSYGDYIYGIRVDEAGAYSIAMEGTHIEYSGDYQHPVFLVMLIAAVLFVVFAFIASKAAKQKAAKKAAAAPVSNAAVAGAADAERVAKLEAENAELKAMVAEMAADAATAKG